MTLGKHHSLTLGQLQQLALGVEKNGSDFESASRNILKVILKAIHFDSAWFIKVDPVSCNIENIYLHNFSQRKFSKYLDDYYTKAPIPTIRQIKNEGFISKKRSDLIEYDLWINTPLYQEILKPLGLLSYLTSACINRQQEYVGYLVFWRAVSRNDFSSQDCFFFEKASLMIAEILGHVRSEEKDAERPEILDLVGKRSDPGVIILGRDNEMVFVNLEAKNILSVIRSGKSHLLKTEDEEFMKRLYKIKVSGKLDLIAIRGTTYSCRPIQLEGNFLNHDSLMILIEPIEEDFSISAHFKESSKTFTAREKAVANLIRKGMTNKEISLDLGIGIHTVKDHVKNIMGKLGTRTRSGIVSKLVK
jgi:DNA-binding CsgD family transcriptional regulator